MRGDSEKARRNVLDNIKVLELNPKEFFDEDTGEYENRFTVNSYKKICVITEDRGNGFQFFRSYLYYNYSDIAGIIIGSTGKDGFRYILQEYTDYDVYIIVFDKGIAQKDYNAVKKAIEEEKKKLPNKKFYLFQPNCLEEIFLSFYRLHDYIDTNVSVEGDALCNELYNILTGSSKGVQYNNYKTITESTAEKICEKYIYELTRGTPFEAFHGQKNKKGIQPKISAYVSPCWRCPCCKVTIYDKIQKVNTSMCKNPGHKNKMDFIAQHSLLCGFTYIIDKILGNKFHQHYWNRIDQNYFNDLVKEL